MAQIVSKLVSLLSSALSCAITSEITVRALDVAELEKAVARIEEYEGARATTFPKSNQGLKRALEEGYYTAYRRKDDGSSSAASMSRGIIVRNGPKGIILPIWEEGGLIVERGDTVLGQMTFKSLESDGCMHYTVDTFISEKQDIGEAMLEAFEEGVRANLSADKPLGAVFIEGCIASGLVESAGYEARTSTEGSSSWNQWRKLFRAEEDNEGGSSVH